MSVNRDGGTTPEKANLEPREFQTMGLTRAELRGGFRGLGLKPGDAVVVHSSLSSLGRVDGGAETVIDGLRAAVGEDGTVMVPTFTRYDEPYDPETSVSTVGAITEALRKRPDAVRSAHPTKSVAAIGPDVAALVGDHEPLESIAPGGPIHRLLEADGKILLLGVDHTTNSALHIAERLAELPYRDQIAKTSVRRADGSIESVEVNRVHCSRGFGVVESVAKRLGALSYGSIGEAATQLTDGEALLSLAVDLLEEEPGFLLCDVPDCDRCAYARQRIASQERAE